MGNACFRFLRSRIVRRKIILLMIGLDNAGKTQTVNNLLGESNSVSIPTVGFKAVNLVHRNTPVVIFDLGGGPEFRQIWPVYYSEVHGIIFVIDSSDISRLNECRNVLEEVLSHERVSGKPVLILANKQDRDGALDDLDIVEQLNIEAIVNRFRCPTLVESYSANMPIKQRRFIFSHYEIDPGLKKGYLWLLNYILRKYGDLNLRIKTDMNAEAMKAKVKKNRAESLQISSIQDQAVDVETETGFANYTYKEDDISKTSRSIIKVKPASASVEHSISSNGISQPNKEVGETRLSPVFGEKNQEKLPDDIGITIELQPRPNVTKLSPLHSIKVEPRTRSSGSTRQRPRTSPEPNALNSGRQMLPSFLHPDTSSEEKGPTNKAAIQSASDPTITTAVIERPVSASQIIRKQLEQSRNIGHRRRLTLTQKIRRNRTSPEETHVSGSLFSYDPLRQGKEVHNKGDFSAKSATIEMGLTNSDRTNHTNHAI